MGLGFPEVSTNNNKNDQEQTRLRAIHDFDLQRVFQGRFRRGYTVFESAMNHNRGHQEAEQSICMKCGNSMVVIGGHVSCTEDERHSTVVLFLPWYLGMRRGYQVQTSCFAIDVDHLLAIDCGRRCPASIVKNIAFAANSSKLQQTQIETTGLRLPRLPLSTWVAISGMFTDYACQGREFRRPPPPHSQRCELSTRRYHQLRA